MTSLFLGFVGFEGPTIQPNVVSVEELLDAKANPYRHRGLNVKSEYKARM